MKLLNLYLSSLILKACSLNIANTMKTKTTSTLEPDMAQIYVQYFRYHGVQSLILVVCNENLTAEKSRLHHLVQIFIKNNFYVRIFNGRDYLTQEETFVLGHSSKFQPKNNFRMDNETRPPRHPLRFQLQPLTHKSGIMFMEFQSECALNVLRWSARPEHNFFTTNRFWLLLAKNDKEISVLEAVENLDIFMPPDGEVRILSYDENNNVASKEKQAYKEEEQRNRFNTFNLTDIFKVSALGALKQRKIGIDLINATDMVLALQHFGSAITYRQDFDGITFATGLVIAFPDVFTNIEDLSIRHIDTISKVNHRLIVELGNKLNFGFNTYQMDNYGWRQPNGSFDGLMGMFQRFELDFCRQAIFMRLDRINLVDFIAETYRIRAGIIFRQPPLSAVANIFALPFDRYVWLSILILMIFTIFIFGIELYYSPHQHDMNIWDCCVFVWGAMCQQGFYNNIGNRSGRIIIFTTFVATLFLFTSFSANIVALLQSPSEAITSLADLSSSPLEIGVQDTQYNKIFFSESTDPVTNRLYHKKISPKGDNIFLRPALGIKKIRTGLFAYQVELQAGYQIISETFSEPEKCGLKELEPFQLPILAIPTRKNFPYKELFRRQIRWQREVGLMNREELKWIQQKPKCEGGVGGFVSIGLTECRYAIAMYGFGMLLGFIVFWLELIFKYLLKHLTKLRNIGELAGAAARNTQVPYI